MIRAVAFHVLCIFVCLGCERPPRPSAPAASTNAKAKLEQSGPSEFRLDRIDAAFNPDLIQSLPGVHDYSRSKAKSPRPSQRIVQICDWHFVPRDDFAADLRSEEPLSDEMIDGKYHEFLDEVEQVQLEQMELLRELIENHGVKYVFVEGLTEPDMPIFEAQIRATRQTAAELDEIKQQRDEALAEIARREFAGEEHEIESQLVSAINGLLERHRLDMLRIGAAGRLYLSGELDSVKALDDADALAASKPMIVDGELRLDTSLEEREDAQVRRLIEHGSFAVAILGGGHSLFDNVESLTDGMGECIEIRTSSYAKFATD